MAKNGKRRKKHFRDESCLRALGNHCRLQRQRKGFSVNRLAREGERLSPSVIMRLETGSGAVTVSSLIRYAQVLEIHPKKLLDFEYDLDG